MTEAEWLACSDPEKMLDFLIGTANDRKMRLFACACCRRIWHLLKDGRIRKAVEVAELHADGGTSEAERKAVFDALLVPLNATPTSYGYYESEPNSAVFGVVIALLADGIFIVDRWTGQGMCGTGDGIIHRAIAVRRDAADYWANEAVRQRQARQWPISRILRRVTEPVLRELCDYWYFKGTYLNARRCEAQHQAKLLHDIYGSLPFRPVAVDPSWLTPSVVGLAQTIYENSTFDRLPFLADALEEAGCDNKDILSHCRGPLPHVRGCWVVDLALGKE